MWEDDSVFIKEKLIREEKAFQKHFSFIKKTFLSFLYDLEADLSIPNIMPENPDYFELNVKREYGDDKIILKRKDFPEPNSNSDYLEINLEIEEIIDRVDTVFIEKDDMKHIIIEGKRNGCDFRVYLIRDWGDIFNSIEFTKGDFFKVKGIFASEDWQL